MKRMAQWLLYAVLNGAQDEVNVELADIASLPPHQRKRPEIVCFPARI